MENHIERMMPKIIDALSECVHRIVSFYAPVVNGARIWFVSSHYHWLLARHRPNYFFGEVEEQQWKGKGRRENFQRRFTARSTNGKGNW